MAKKIKEKADKDAQGSELGRRFKQNPALFIGTFVVLVLVVVSFVLVPALVPESTRGGGDFNFGYYDNVPISWVPGNAFSRFQDQVVRYYQSQGIEVNDFRAAYQVWRQAFDMTVVHIAVLQMMKKSNYAVPEKKVNRSVLQREEFQENGRFSQALYQRMSDSDRLVVWRQTQDDLAKSVFFDDFFGMTIPSGEADFIASMSSPMRSFQMVSFNIDDFPDSEYLAFARENSALFDSIHLSKITISNEKEAGKILASVKDGTTTFEDAATAQSQDSYKERGGDMGKRYRMELNAEIPNSADRDAIFNLAKGELSGVIPVGEQWAFFRVEEGLTPADFEDGAVLERVKSYVRESERGRMEDRAIAQANDFISEAGEAGFDNAASYRNLTTHSFGPIPINYGGVDLFTSLQSKTVAGFSSEYLTGLSNNEDFWKIAFSKTKVNTPSEPLVQGDNVLVFYPYEETENDEDSINSIKSMYTSYWLNYMTEQSLQVYFINNEKMEDRFWDAYTKYLMPN